VPQTVSGVFRTAHILIARVPATGTAGSRQAASREILLRFS